MTESGSSIRVRVLAKEDDHPDAKTTQASNKPTDGKEAFRVRIDIMISSMKIDPDDTPIAPTRKSDC